MAYMIFSKGLRLNPHQRNQLKTHLDHLKEGLPDGSFCCACFEKDKNHIRGTVRAYSPSLRLGSSGSLKSVEKLSQFLFKKLWSKVSVWREKPYEDRREWDNQSEYLEKCNTHECPISKGFFSDQGHRVEMSDAD